MNYDHKDTIYQVQTSNSISNAIIYYNCTTTAATMYFICCQLNNKVHVQFIHNNNFCKFVASVLCEIIE